MRKIIKKTISELSVHYMQEKIYGERYIGASISQIKFSPQTAIDIKNFLDKKKNMLIFCGNPGIGKTYFCASLTEWAMTEFNHFRRHHEADLLRAMRGIIDSGYGDYITHLQFLIDDDLIFLDDIGSQGVNQWREEVLFDAIDFRYNSMKPTVITSNFSRQDFEKKYHPRVLSRLFASENTIIELHNETDMRSLGK